jgi:HEAT repeat protein
MPIRDPILKRLAIATLIKSLTQDASPLVRVASATALGKMKDEQAIFALCQAQVTELDPSVRQQIAIAIGKIGDTPMSGDRIINTGGGDYLESGDKVTGTQIKIHMSQDLTQTASQIQDLLEQLKQQGITVDAAAQKVAQDMAEQAKADPTAKEKLLKWGQSLGDATVTDVVKGVVKLALRSAGLPLP